MHVYKWPINCTRTRTAEGAENLINAAKAAEKHRGDAEKKHNSQSAQQQQTHPNSLASSSSLPQSTAMMDSSRHTTDAGAARYVDVSEYAHLKM